MNAENPYRWLANICRRSLAITAIALSFFQPSWAKGVEGKRPPNIVLINCDDLGYADIEPFGGLEGSTPNLAQMAREGARFNRFYVAQPVCSASRAALLTGCYPNRVGIRFALLPNAKTGIHSDETTLAEIAKQKKYATAIFGKWHLGDEPEFSPLRHGFDEYMGIHYSNDMWPYHPLYANLPQEPGKPRRGYPDLPLYEGDKIIQPSLTPEDQKLLTTQFTERAVSFIERHKDEPFFLYVAHTMPHVPLFVNDQRAGASGRGLYADVVREIDWSLGEILTAIQKAGLDDSTLVMFTSDNGPWICYGEHSGSAGKLREGKFTVFEGGVRVPFLARWKGQIPAGLSVDEPAMTIDLLPTICRLIGAETPNRKLDGLDIWPLFSGAKDAKNPHSSYYLYFNENELHAVMSGPWKLVFPHRYPTLAGAQGGKDGLPSNYVTGMVFESELYNLQDDPEEKHNVIEAHPDIRKMLEQEAEKARADLGDSLEGRPGTNRRPAGRTQ